MTDPRSAMSPEGSALCGILLLDKPLGLSSNAALQRVRQLLGRPKAGHTGSLDPLATGMLPICIGEATKLAGDLLAGAKAYTVQMRLGERTDTGDAEGAIVERLPVPALDRPLIEAALASQRGDQQQVPPMYSALKRAGEPLYRLARRGVTVERAPRSIRIGVLELLDYTATTLRLRVECSKGTYIRTLVEQVAGQLGSCAHVVALRRDFVEPFQHEPMVTLEALQRAAGVPRLLAADLAVGHLPALHLSEAQARALTQGRRIPVPGVAQGRLRLYDAAGVFIGLGVGEDEAQGGASGTVRVQRLFASV
jgi:tRNA pseudouridine55 synthase